MCYLLFEGGLLWYYAKTMFTPTMFSHALPWAAPRHLPQSLALRNIWRAIVAILIIIIIIIIIINDLMMIMVIIIIIMVMIILIIMI